MRLLLLLCWALAPCSAVGQERVPEVARAAATVSDEMLAWRRQIHQHPELGNREFKTAALVAAHLRLLGLEVKTGVAHTGVVAVVRGGKPGPRIALPADMDALPVTPAGVDPVSAPSNHSPAFFLDEGALQVGTRALLQVSLDYLGYARMSP